MNGLEAIKKLRELNKSGDKQVYYDIIEKDLITCSPHSTLVKEDVKALWDVYVDYFYYPEFSQEEQECIEKIHQFEKKIDFYKIRDLVSFCTFQNMYNKDYEKHPITFEDFRKALRCLGIEML